jgi:Sugar-transfer associated ATP-grasp
MRYRDPHFARHRDGATRMTVRWRALLPPPFLGSEGAGDERATNVRRLCSRVLWRNLTELQRVAAVLLIALWPLRAMVTIYPQIRRYAEGVRQETGKSRFRQFLEQLSLILRHRIPPKHYYRFRLYRPDLRRQAGDFLLRNQMDEFIYPLLQTPEAARSQPLKDKMKFAEYCRANELPHVQTLMLFAGGRGRAIEGTLDGRDLFVKPVRGSRGRSTERWTSNGGERYRSTRGQVLEQAALLRGIAKQSGREPFLLQPAVRNHPAFLDLTAGALCTMRLVSWRNEAGAFEVTDATIRMPVDPTSPVDNTHAGAITAAIDIATGTLGLATDIVWHDTHPVTGASIAGRRLSFWSETVELARRAHEAFDLHVVIGWDIAVLHEGPCLIEGNERPGVSMQHDMGVPLGNRRFGALLAYHLKPYL